jgi:hypothetical protein
MFDRMSDSCRDAFRAAHKIARACGREILDTDAILLGLTKAGDATVAARILKDAGLWDLLLKKVQTMGDLPKGFGVPFTQSEEVRQTVEAADVYAMEFDHHYIGTEHIFLGMMGRCKLLTEVCKEGNVEIEDLRKSIYNLLGMDSNTDEDYGKHRRSINLILMEYKDDREAVKAISGYVKRHLPT